MLSIEIVSLLICFGCMAYMVSHDATTEQDAGVHAQSDADVRTIGILICLATSWAYAGSAVLNRALKEFHWVMIATYYGLVGLTLGITLVLVTPLFD